MLSCNLFFLFCFVFSLPSNVLGLFFSINTDELNSFFLPSYKYLAWFCPSYLTSPVLVFIWVASYFYDLSRDKMAISCTWCIFKLVRQLCRTDGPQQSCFIYYFVQVANGPQKLPSRAHVGPCPISASSAAATTRARVSQLPVHIHLPPSSFSPHNSQSCLFKARIWSCHYLSPPPKKPLWGQTAPGLKTESFPHPGRPVGSGLRPPHQLLLMHVPLQSLQPHWFPVSALHSLFFSHLRAFARAVPSAWNTLSSP